MRRISLDLVWLTIIATLASCTAVERSFDMRPPPPAEAGAPTPSDTPDAGSNAPVQSKGEEAPRPSSPLHPAPRPPSSVDPDPEPLPSVPTPADDEEDPAALADAGSAPPEQSDDETIEPDAATTETETEKETETETEAGTGVAPPDDQDAGVEPTPNQPGLIGVELVLSAEVLTSLDDSVSYDVLCTFDDDSVEACEADAFVSLDATNVVSLNTAQATLVPITNGTAQLFATVFGVNSDPALLSVNLGPICRELRIEGVASAAAGTRAALAATCDYDDDREGVDVTELVLWETSDEDVVSIAAAGVFDAHQVGVATISASLDNPDATIRQAQRQLAVSAGQLVAIVVSPTGPAAVAAGLTTPLSAECTYTDVSVDCTSAVSWKTSNASVATVGPSGVVTGHVTGSANVHATLGGIDSAPVLITVGSPVLVSIAVTPAQVVTLEVNAQRQLSATCVMSDGTSASCTGMVTWESSAAEVLSIASGGRIFGLDTGTSLIRATRDGIQSGTLTATVVPPAGCEDAISFPDANLLKDVRDITGKPSGAIYFEDVKTITYFEHLNSNGLIADLTGLRCLTGLTFLSISESTFEDITELIGLVHLETLSVRWTKVTSVPNLSLLTKLQSLDLVGTEITDLTEIVASTSIGAGDTVNVLNTDLNCTDPWILGQIDELVERGVTVHHICGN